jgi:hypothetical protein
VSTETFDVARDVGRELERFIHELAAELAFTDRETWGLLGFDERRRYLELAHRAVEFLDGRSAEGLADLADVVAALYRITGTERMGCWLVRELRDELRKGTPAA